MLCQLSYASLGFKKPRHSIFGIAVDRKHTLKWLFPQEKATYQCTQEVSVYSENARRRSCATSGGGENRFRTSKNIPQTRRASQPRTREFRWQA